MKIFKILLLNFCIFLVFMILTEGISFYAIMNENKSFLSFQKALHPAFFKYPYNKKKPFSFSYFKDRFRPISYKNNKKRPVILFGCSVTYGFLLNDNQTFSYKLSNYTNRTVYNRGFPGTSVPFMYYQLKSTNIKKDIPDAEYIIYTFIDAHLDRLLRYRSDSFNSILNVKYKLVNGKLIEEKPLSTVFLSTYINTLYEEKYSKLMSKQRECKELFYALMDASRKEARKKYPNVKFVVLVYGFPDDRTLNDELKKKGFTVLYTYELLNSFDELSKRKYRTIDNLHPSEQAWDVLIPKLVKQLNM